MAFIPLPNGVRIAMEFVQNGQLVVNVYYLTYPSPIATANLTALATVFKDWWFNTERANRSTALSLVQVVATDIRVAGGLQTAVVNAPPVAGTIAGSAAPNNVAACLSLRTGFSGRSNRGRKYYGGIVAADVADNDLGTTRVTNMLTSALTLRTNITTAGGEWVVASFFTLGAPRVTGVSKAISGFIMDFRVDTQRRRLPNEGI